MINLDKNKEHSVFKKNALRGQRADKTGSGPPVFGIS